MKNLVTTYTEISNSCYEVLAVKYVSDGITVFFATDYTLAFTIKITLCLMFLIVIRGCVPRYRYDFLTKMGWVKFLGYVLMLFLVSVSLFLIW